MAASTFSKTGGVVLLAHTQHASNTLTKGSAVDVAALIAARIFVSLGRVNATALSNEVLFVLQASAKDSGDDSWYPIYQFTSASGKTAGLATTLNAGTSAGATTFTTAADFLDPGKYFYLRETGTPGNSEWGQTKTKSGGTTTPMDALTRAHTNGITATGLAEHFSWTESLVGIKRLRLIVDSASQGAAGQTVDVTAWLVTLDSVQTA